MDDKRKELLKGLPKIDEVILLLEKGGIYEKAPRVMVTEICRGVVQSLRDGILAASDKQLAALSTDAAQAARRVEAQIESLRAYKLKRVINATGVILHTNLGRAPLCYAAMKRLLDVGMGYSNLEFNLDKGERGLRYDAVSSLLCSLTGAEDALIVNNNAVALLTVKRHLAAQRHVIFFGQRLVEANPVKRAVRAKLLAKRDVQIKKAGRFIR